MDIEFGTGARDRVADERGVAIDPRRFRDVMGKFATGVTVVSYLADGQPAGLTANAFASVSLDPPLVLVSIRNTSRFMQALSSGGRYGINFLTCDQHHISDQFGGRPRAALPTPFRIRDGVPLIEDCLASLLVKVVDFYPAGDHKLVVGRVESLQDQRRSFTSVAPIGN